jgi:predicted Ser/Thr protein kinase
MTQACSHGEQESSDGARARKAGTSSELSQSRGKGRTVLLATREAPEACMDVISHLKARYERTREEELSLEDYLAECKRNPLAYATAAERMLRAIGEPQSVDTRNDPRLSRLFANKVIKVYPAFAEFYGMEDAIEQVVSYFRHAAQGLEEKKQILYLLGPVGGGKSSIAERAEAADAGRALLRHQGQPGERIAAGPV